MGLERGPVGDRWTWRCPHKTEAHAPGQATRWAEDGELGHRETEGPLLSLEGAARAFGTYVSPAHQIPSCVAKLIMEMETFALQQMLISFRPKFFLTHF
jgi:hypothetical protein